MHWRYSLDATIKTLNYLNPLWYFGVMDQEFNINITWNAKAKFKKTFPGYKLEGWPLK